MGKRHSFFLLDVSVSPQLGSSFFHGNALPSTAYGLRSDADDMDVIDLASDRHSLLITADIGFVQRCRRVQDQQKFCLFGLLVLPQGIETQRRILGDISKGRKRLVHPQFERPVTWADVHEENLLVVAHIDGCPQVSDLCHCRWEESRN